MSRALHPTFLVGLCSVALPGGYRPGLRPPALALERRLVRQSSGSLDLGAGQLGPELRALAGRVHVSPCDAPEFGRPAHAWTAAAADVAHAPFRTDTSLPLATDAAALDAFWFERANEAAERYDAPADVTHLCDDSRSVWVESCGQSFDSADAAWDDARPAECWQEFAPNAVVTCVDDAPPRSTDRVSVVDVTASGDDPAVSALEAGFETNEPRSYEFGDVVIRALGGD